MLEIVKVYFGAATTCIFFFLADLLPIWLKVKFFRGIYKDATQEKLNKLAAGKYFGGMSQFDHIVKSRLLYYKMNLKQGSKLPDGLEVTNYKTKKVTTINDLMRPGIPLVLNFGSCT